jgi:hypothetical protein
VQSIVSKIMVLATLLATAGCTSSELNRQHPGMRSRNLLFNPQWNSFPIADNFRADWPSTEVDHAVRETVDYTETYIDLQTRSQNVRNDVPYRRFHSVRSGRTRRR